MGYTAAMSRSKKLQKTRFPIKHWSHSSLMSYLRNPLAWYKRYVEEIRDQPSNPSSIVGRAAHLALEHFYSGVDRETAARLGFEYIRNIPEMDINFGKAKTKKAKKEKRAKMERDYLQAVSHYLEKPPRHKVVGVEVVGVAKVEGLPLPVKAVSDLIESRVERGALDIVDHKFVDHFSPYGPMKTLFVIQAIFNYYTVRELYGKPVKRFIVYECKKSKNTNGKPQVRRYVIEYEQHAAEFAVFHRLVKDATNDILNRKHFLPNPSDMFEGENSFDIYRMGLLEN
jgi:hypothetical protein